MNTLNFGTIHRNWKWSRWVTAELRFQLHRIVSWNKLNNLCRIGNSKIYTLFSTTQRMLYVHVNSRLENMVWCIYGCIKVGYCCERCWSHKFSQQKLQCTKTCQNPKSISCWGIHNSCAASNAAVVIGQIVDVCHAAVSICRVSHSRLKRNRGLHCQCRLE